MRLQKRGQYRKIQLVRGAPSVLAIQLCPGEDEKNGLKSDAEEVVATYGSFTGWPRQMACLL